MGPLLFDVASSTLPILKIWFLTKLVLSDLLCFGCCVCRWQASFVPAIPTTSSPSSCRKSAQSQSTNISYCMDSVRLVFMQFYHCELFLNAFLLGKSFELHYSREVANLMEACHTPQNRTYLLSGCHSC